MSGSSQDTRVADRAYRTGAAAPAASRVVTMFRDARERMALATRLSGARLEHATDAASLRALLATPADCVVTDPADASGVCAAPVVAWIRSTHPALPVLVCVALCPGDVRALAPTIEAGATHTVVRGQDDMAAAVRAALAARTVAVAAALILGATLPVVPHRIHPLFRHLATEAAHALAVETVAHAIGWSRRTLHDRLVRHGLPEPRAVVAWHRLLHAVWQLEQSVDSAEAVAVRLDFPSAAALHNQMRRHLRRAVSETRRPGAFDELLGRFAGTLDAARRRTAPVTLHLVRAGCPPRVGGPRTTPLDSRAHA